MACFQGAFRYLRASPPPLPEYLKQRCRALKIARLRALASGETPGITRQAPSLTKETTLDRDTGYFSQRPIHPATYDHC